MDMTEEELEAARIQQEIFADIMHKFDCGQLTFKAKGGIETVVTNERQAYAIAMSMARRAERRYLEQCKQATIPSIVK